MRLGRRDEVLHASLDRLVIGLVLLDSAGRVRYLNPLAKSILHTHPALCLRGERIAVTEPEQAKQLEQLIAAAIEAPPDGPEGVTAIGLRHRNVLAPLPVLARLRGFAG